MSNEQQTTLSRRNFAGMAASTLALLALAPVATAHAEDLDDDDCSLSVDASATVEAVPDVANVSFSVNVTGDDAAKAQEDVAAIVDAATAAIIALGVAEDSVNVSNMNVWPYYEYSSGILGRNKTPRITGYEVDVQMSVKNVGVDQIGDVIAAAMDAGVNGVGGVSYFCSSYDDLYDTALAQACNRARHKADVMADALGYVVDGMSHANIGYESQRYKAAPTMAAGSMDFAYEEAAVAEDSLASVSFDPGTVEIEASVSITFELVPRD